MGEKGSEGSSRAVVTWGLSSGNLNQRGTDQRELEPPRGSSQAGAPARSRDRRKRIQLLPSSNLLAGPPDQNLLARMLVSVIFRGQPPPPSHPEKQSRAPVGWGLGLRPTKLMTGMAPFQRLVPVFLPSCRHCLRRVPVSSSTFYIVLSNRENSSSHIMRSLKEVRLHFHSLRASPKTHQRPARSFHRSHFHAQGVGPARSWPSASR